MSIMPTFSSFSRPIPSVSHPPNNIIIPTNDLKLSKKKINNKRSDKFIVKRQQPQNSVVHVTITAAGTVIYTHTATSYSYVPTYSTVDGNNNSSSSNNGSNGSNTDNSNHNNSNGPNTGAIIGGVVGGVAFIALIVFGFLFMRRSKKKKRVLQQQEGGYIEDTGSYFRGMGARTSTGGVANGMNMTSSLPAPRHLVAPYSGLGTEREGDGLESKYYQHDGGYYDDIVPPPPNNSFPKGAYYSTTDSVTSDSLPSTTVDNSFSSQSYALNGGFRNVPNEVDNSPHTTLNVANQEGIPTTATAEERHVPHLRETFEEPPHSKE